MAMFEGRYDQWAVEGRHELLHFVQGYAYSLLEVRINYVLWN